MAQTTIWKEAEVPTVYSNLIGFSMTPFDISFLFGEVFTATQETITGIPRVKVTISPEQAQLLSSFLIIALDRYTKETGPLRNAAKTDQAQINRLLDAQRIIKQ